MPPKKMCERIWESGPEIERQDGML